MQQWKSPYIGIIFESFVTINHKLQVLQVVGLWNLILCLSLFRAHWHVVVWQLPYCWMATATQLDGYRHTLWLTCRTGSIIRVKCLRCSWFALISLTIYSCFTNSEIQVSDLRNLNCFQNVYSRESNDQLLEFPDWLNTVKKRGRTYSTSLTF